MTTDRVGGVDYGGAKIALFLFICIPLVFLGIAITTSIENNRINNELSAKHYDKIEVEAFLRCIGEPETSAFMRSPGLQKLFIKFQDGNLDCI